MELGHKPESHLEDSLRTGRVAKHVNISLHLTAILTNTLEATAINTDTAGITTQHETKSNASASAKSKHLGPVAMENLRYRRKYGAIIKEKNRRQKEEVAGKLLAAQQKE